MGFSLSKAVAEAKALNAHPALMGSDRVSVYSPGAVRQEAVISQRNATRHGDAYGGGQAIDWLYDCIGLYTDPAGTAPFKLTDGEGKHQVEKKVKGTPPDHVEGPKDLYELLKKPNPFMLYSELMALLVIDLMLVGNAYWMKWSGQPGTLANGKPLALYRLSPAYVQIKPGQFGPAEYRYQPPGAKDPLKIKPENVIHYRRPNPHDAYYGMGVVQGAGRSMDLEIALTDTVASYYENKADPSMIVQSDRRVPRDVFNKLRAQLRSRASGSRNAGELLVLEAGLKASSLSASASDALFETLSKMSRDRLFTKFRASPMLFGIMDQSSGSNKISDARREFDNYSLRPFLKILSEQITAGLMGPWGVDFKIDHRTLLPAEDAVKVAGEIAKLPAVKVREVRRQYEQFGIEESTGDPKLDEELLNLPGGELGPDGKPLNPAQGGFPDQPLPGEKGRPPKVSNTRTFSQSRAGAKTRQPAGKAFADIAANIEVLAAEEAIRQEDPEFKAVPDFVEPDRATVGNHLPDEKAPLDTFARARQADIDGVRNNIATGLRQNAIDLERDLLREAEGKALKTSDIVARMRQSKAWAKFKQNVEQTLQEGALRAAQSGVMHSGLTPEDEVDYDAIVKSVMHRPKGGLRSIMNTLRDRVVGRVKEARANNAERTEYEAAIRAVIAEWADSQAATIADTEATHTYNEATLTAAELSGVAEVYVTDGEDDDQPCKDAHGSVWDIETARANRLEHPNCRRAFLPLPEVS